MRDVHQDMHVRAFKLSRLSETMARLDAERIAAGQCRHCGGAVPCWSAFGDEAVGVRKGSRKRRRK